MNTAMLHIRIAGRDCALDAKDAHSVIELGEIVPIPRVEPRIVGLSALRSRALTVIDCRIAMGFADDQQQTDSRAVVIRRDGHSYALRVDAIGDIVEARGEPIGLKGGFGKPWEQAAIGLIESAQGPLVLLSADAFLARVKPQAAA